MDTAGDNLIVVKTEVGQAQPAALTIDHAEIDAIVGTVAGDDTILIAVKNARRATRGCKGIVKLFAPRPADGLDGRRHSPAAPRGSMPCRIR